MANEYGQRLVCYTGLYTADRVTGSDSLRVTADPEMIAQAEPVPMDTATWSALDEAP